jgi:hypothetical protein
MIVIAIKWLKTRILAACLVDSGWGCTKGNGNLESTGALFQNARKKEIQEHQGSFQTTPNFHHELFSWREKRGTIVRYNNCTMLASHFLYLCCHQCDATDQISTTCVCELFKYVTWLQTVPVSWLECMIFYFIPHYSSSTIFLLFWAQRISISY